MIPMDDMKSRQVWSRVMNAPCPAADGTQKKDAVLTARQVLELAQEEWADAAVYGSLVRCAPQCAREALRQMARDEACHARRLAALYFLLSGEKACPEPGKPVCTACFNETLRQRYGEELRGQKRYQELAPQAGAQRCLFEQLACDEGRHAQTICCILQHTL